MFSKILIPLDGSDGAAGAIAPARTIAKATGASIQLLNVHDGPTSTEVTLHLAQVAAELTAIGIAVETSTRTGSPATEIIAEAVASGADVIAMATHGRSGLSRAFLGSVAESVLGASPVPVLLFRPDGHNVRSIGTVLVPVDGSPGGTLALASAVALARSVSARVVLLQVVVPVLAYTAMDVGIYGGGLWFDPAWDEESLASAKRYVDGMATRLVQSGVRAEGIALMGGALTPSMSVAETIIAAADKSEADLIVMSTHAHTGAARVFLGSVADALVRHSHRPVLMVRRGGAAEEAANTEQAARATA